MRKITNIVSSVSYYKQKNIVLFIIYSVTLFALSTCELLKLSQMTKVQLLGEHWSLFSRLLPNQATSNFASIIAADVSLQANYRFFSSLIIALVFVLVTLLTGSLIFKRRKDILSLLSLGIKRSKIIWQLIIEGLLPVIFSFIAVTTFLLIFQFSFKNFIVTTNDTLFANELPHEFNVIKSRTNSANMKTANLTKKEGELLLPFNEQLFYHTESLNDSFSYTNLFNLFSKTFLLILLIAFSITSLGALAAVELIAKKIQ